GLDAPAKPEQSLDQDRGGGDAVNVEVAVDGNQLAFVYGAAKAIEGGPHIREKKRVVFDDSTVHEGGRLGGIAYTAMPEEVADERRVGGGCEVAFGLAATEAPATARRGGQLAIGNRRRDREVRCHAHLRLLSVSVAREARGGRH